METDWIYPAKPLLAYDFANGPDCTPGVLVEVKIGKKKRTLLVGHVNPLLGECDDCPVYGDRQKDTVIRYRRVWTP